MRTPSYLSPSALDVWRSKGAEDYYLQYLADHRMPRFPQTEPMSVGSAFDAYVKADLHEKIFGKGTDPEYEFPHLFEVQVEDHNKDWALVAGKHVFDSYVLSGAFADLLKELENAEGSPRFETTIKGTIGGIPFLGKPDLYYVHKSGQRIILDWKVNGYCGKRPTSPKKGFAMCRDGWTDVPPSRNTGFPHKDFFPFNLNGVTINSSAPLDHVEKKWATQTSTYAWLLGCDVGSEFIVAIDQLACQPNNYVVNAKPLIRVAAHRSIVTDVFQKEAFAHYKELWETIASGYILRDRPKADALARQKVLDTQYKAFEGPDADLMHDVLGRGNRYF